MKDGNQNLIAFFVTLLVVIGLAVLFSYRTVSNHEVPATDTTEVCTSWQDTTPWYDSAFVYEMKNYKSTYYTVAGIMKYASSSEISRSLTCLMST